MRVTILVLVKPWRPNKRCNRRAKTPRVSVHVRRNGIREKGMRALLTAVGTRGDVHPALAFALELRKLGYAVRMCVSPNFVEWAKSLGLEALPIGVEMRM